MCRACSTHGRDEKCIHRFSRKTERKRTLGGPKYRWVGNLKMYLQQIIVIVSEVITSTPDCSTSSFLFFILVCLTYVLLCILLYLSNCLDCCRLFLPVQYLHIVALKLIAWYQLFICSTSNLSVHFTPFSFFPSLNYFVLSFFNNKVKK